jgi:hypothetical protein
MRFRPANISLINRRLYLPRLLLTLSSVGKDDQHILTGHYISMSGLATNCPEPAYEDRNNSSLSEKGGQCTDLHFYAPGTSRRLSSIGIAWPTDPEERAD